MDWTTAAKHYRLAIAAHPAPVGDLDHATIAKLNTLATDCESMIQ